MLDQPLTVVLPMYNSEHILHRSVMEVMEMAHSFASDFSVVIVDDGSTDETYESACELARIYPQIKVLRQPERQGLRRIVEAVRNYCLTNIVIVHDGVSPIDVDQLRALLRSPDETSSELATESMRDAIGESSSASRRFASLRALHDSMEHAHRGLMGLCWMKLEKPLMPRRCYDIAPQAVITDLGNLSGNPMSEPLG